MAKTQSEISERLIGDAELVELLGWAKHTPASLRSRGKFPFPYVKIGRSVRVKLSVVQRFIADNTVPAAVRITA